MKKLISTILFACACALASVNTSYVYQPYEETRISNIAVLQIEAVGTVISKTQPNYSLDESYDIARILYEESQYSSFDYSYVLAITMTESRFNIKARSYCGAMGLMQLMPRTFESVAKKNGLPYNRSDAYTPRANVQVGIAYLESLYARFGNLDHVAAGYNGGPGTAMKYIKKQAGQDVKVPKETLSYVKKVKEYHEYFSVLLANHSY